MDEAGHALAGLHGAEAEPHRKGARHDQGVADPQGGRGLDVHPELAHVGDDVGGGEAGEQHHHGEEDEVHQHLLGALSHGGIESFEDVHAALRDVLGGVGGVHIAVCAHGTTKEPG